MKYKKIIVISSLLISVFFQGNASAACSATVFYSGGLISVYGRDGTWANISCINKTVNNAAILSNPSGKTWLLNNTMIYVKSTGTTLYINDTDAAEVRLSNSRLMADGILEINNTHITGWNASTNSAETAPVASRSDIWINWYFGTLNITNSNITYLGYDSWEHYGIFLNGAKSASIRNTTFFGNFAGIAASNTSMNISGSVFDNNTYGIWIPATSIKAVTITDITMNGNLKGMLFEKLGSSNLTVRNVTITNSQEENIKISNWGGTSPLSNALFRNISLSHSGTGGIFDNFYATSNDSSYPVRNLTVIDSVFLNSSNANIYLINTTVSNISGNTVKYSTDDGIILEDSWDNTLNNNHIVRPTRFGFYFNKVTYNNTLRNNTLDVPTYTTGESYRSGHYGGAWMNSGNNIIYDDAYQQDTIYAEIGDPEPNNLTLVYTTNSMYRIKGYTVNGSSGYTIYPDKVTIKLLMPDIADDSQYWFRENNITKLNGSIIPSSDSIVVTVTTWNIDGDYYKKWIELSDNASVTTNHTIGDLPVNSKVKVKKNGITLDSYRTNSTGYITFTYEGGYSNNTFEIIYYDTFVKMIVSEISDLLQYLYRLV